MDVMQAVEELKIADMSLYEAGVKESQERFLKLAKPLYSLGRLEESVHCLCGILKMREPSLPVTKLSIERKEVLVFCADNGVVAEGVTQTGSEVTAVVANNMLHHKSSVCLMSEVAKANVVCVDVGMNTEVEGVISKKCKRGTNNFAKRPAMSPGEAIFAMQAGFDLVREKKEEGITLLANGEMGIGNTTTSSAIASVLLNKDPEEVTGKGAGLSKEGIQRKIAVIRDAIELYDLKREDPLDLLCCVGGFDIAAMAGMYIGAAYYHLPIVMDGFISTVAALLAVRFCNNVSYYLIASHVSKEPAATWILEALLKKPLLCCDMCLGEGTGAVAAMPLLDMAVKEFLEMPTFEEIKIEEYKPL